jgi:hypothetical protein
MTTVVSHADAMDETPDPEIPERAKRPRSSSARYKPRSWPSTSSWTRPARARCYAARACTPRCSPSGASSVTEARSKPWVHPRAGRRLIRWSGRTLGCAGRTSSWPASWTRPARSSRSRERRRARSAVWIVETAT